MNETNPKTKSTNQMRIRFDRMAEGDREAVIDLFNYYIENSFAAYPEEKVPYGLFDQFLKLTEGYPALTVRDGESADRVVGFAFLRPYHPLGEFQRAAEITYFIEPGYTGRGIGSRILERMIEAAGRKGIALPFVDEAQVVDHRLILTIDDPEARNPEIVRLLVGAGVDVQFVGELRHSLEDVYLRLVKDV